MNGMTGEQFERYVMERLAAFGFRYISGTSKSGDYGADIICYDGWFCKVVIQCKCYDSPVGVKAVQEVNAARQHYRASRAIVITNNTFTKPAITLAQECGVELWEKFH